MRLIPASGDLRLQRALAHSYVHTIVDILLAETNPNLFALVARLLQKYTRHAQTGLEEALQYLQSFYRFIQPEGEMMPEHIMVLTRTIHNLYQQSDEEIKLLRGAIVEVFTYKLVQPRYKPGECLSNQRFLDGHGRQVTDQVDVAAISRDRNEIEGYECKMKVDGIDSPDCTSLAHLVAVAQNWDYRTHVGIVTFDEETTMKFRLARLNPAPSISLYGLNSIFSLRYTPFSKQ